MKEKNQNTTETIIKMTRCTACDEPLTTQKSAYAYFPNKNSDLCNRCTVIALSPFYTFLESDGKGYSHAGAYQGLRSVPPDAYE